MANLTELSQWEDVIRQIENGEAATGGADGLANIQAKQLANRTKWLKENYLPLAGGKFTGNWFGRDVDNSTLFFIGASNVGASLRLCGAEYEDSGIFNLIARNADKSVTFYGHPDGTLGWNNTDLAGSAIVAKSLGDNGYVKYASGLIIQWGNFSKTMDTGEECIFPISFPNNYSFIATADHWKATIAYSSKLANKITINSSFNGNHKVTWLAIGY